MPNLTRFIHYHATHRPEAPALIHEGERIGYGDLLDRCLRLAGWLADAGIGPGDVVAVVMKNSPAFLEIAFAASHLGAVFLPINYRLAPPEIAYIRANAGARLVLADAEFAPLLAGAGDAVLLDDTMQRDSRALSAGHDRRERLHRRTPGDLFRLVYTSGTTDHPKGVMHSYANIYWKSMDQVMALGLSAADRLLISGPLYHIGAFDLPGTAVLWMGGCLTILRDFSPEAALAAIERDRITGMWWAPVMLNQALGFADRHRFDTGSVRWCIGGGERTPESRIRAFGSLFPRGRYIDAYGLTESCGGDTFMQAGREIEKIGSVGTAIANVELTIRDEAGGLLPAGRDGEICLRGEKVTRGYWRDPARTEAAFHPGGWLRTGDVGHLDGEDFLYLTDRRKDMIISGGENIASSEVERVLYELPEVAEAAVIARPDPRWGERPVAIIVPRPGAVLDLEGVARFCRQHLAGFKVPKELHLMDELPRNPSGKVLKRELRARLDEG